VAAQSLVGGQACGPRVASGVVDRLAEKKSSYSFPSTPEMVTQLTSQGSDMTQIAAMTTAETTGAGGPPTGTRSGESIRRLSGR